MFRFFAKKDAQIQRDALSILDWDPSVNSSQITLSTKDGIVTMRGSVPLYLEKAQAAQAVRRVPGVRGIVDEIEVQIMGSYERSDEDLIRAALNCLEWNAFAPKDLTVTVDRGWITLKGQVRWDYQRSAAGAAVEQLMGVRGVSNLISIKSEGQLGNLKERVETALRKVSDGQSLAINVSVNDGKVILGGHVRTFSDLNEAIEVTWGIAGVSTVANNLQVLQ